MSAPVNKKFLQEFEEKTKKSSCFGLLRGRKVSKAVTQRCDKIVRSPGLDDVRIFNNPVFNALQAGKV